MCSTTLLRDLREDGGVVGGYQAVERWGIINVSGIGVEKGEEEAGRPDLLACRREGGAREARKACRG